MQNYEDSPYFKMGKQLTAVDKSERDEAVQIIKKNVCMIPQISELNMLKLWKGLFYTFWMSDKPDVQEELAESLVELIHLFVNQEMTELYIRCCWKTMAREWGGIDHLRLDKYCMFVRKMLKEVLLRVKKNLYKQNYVDNCINALFEEFVYPQVHGLALLIIYNFNNELASADSNISTTNFMKFAVPFLNLLEGPKANKVYTSNLFIRFFKSLCTDFVTKSEKPLNIKPNDSNQLNNVDLRYLYHMFKNDALDRNKCSNQTKRRYLYQLTSCYEHILNSRFDSLELPKEEPKKSPKKTTKSELPIKNKVTKTKKVSSTKPKQVIKKSKK